MSSPRYAPITSSLLVRKGEARPWHIPGSEFAAAPPRIVEMQHEVQHEQHEVQHEKPAPVAPRPAPESMAEPQPRAPVAALAPCNSHVDGEEHDKRCTLRLSHAEYERIGIIAVKKEISRQHVLRQAIEHYLADAKEEYQSACGCLGGVCRSGC